MTSDPIKVAFIRGKYLNNFEGQNYRFEKNKVSLTGISSLNPINQHFPFKNIRLSSLADFPLFPRVVKYLSNRTLGDSQILFGLEKLQSNFDIFHSADPHYYYSYQLAKLRYQNKIKNLILTSWETIPFNNESVLRKKTIKNFAKKNADVFVCYTNKARDCLIKEGINDSKIKIIKLGVNLTKFKPNKAKNRNTLNLLFVGRLVEEKGIRDFYEAFRQVFKENPKRLMLTIIGEGPLKKELEKLALVDGLSRAISFQTRNYDQLPKTYQQADIFVMPSKTTHTWEEQYGMVLIEAMASGLPILAYNTGAIGENLQDAGILIKPDLKNLITGLKKLIENVSLRTKLGTMGRQRAITHFDSKSTASKIQELYLSL